MERPVLPVKRAMVSANVEIIREDLPALSAPAVYPSAVPTCKKCLQERNRNNRDYRQNKRGKRKQNRANTPIVIQLKDTLKAAIQQKQRSKQNLLQKQESVELRDDCDIETDNSSDRSEVNIRTNKQRKNAKNLSAFINVVKKTHKKDYSSQKNMHGSSFENPFNEKLVAEYVLNNVNDAQVPSKLCAKKNIVECENVDVICNDLTSVEGLQEDTEDSEISSTTSSSGFQSDSDISVPPQDGGTGNQEFSSYELQQLAAYTTGCPLIRYDCPPANCPQCQWYSQVAEAPTHQHQHKSHYSHSPYKTQPNSGRKNKSKKVAQPNQKVPSRKTRVIVEVDNISNTESDPDLSEMTDSPSETSVDTDTSVCDTTSPVSKGKLFPWGERRHTKSHGKQLVDIDLSRHKRNKKRNSYHQKDVYLDSVYVDLTDTDVTLTVYYHHSLMDMQPSYLGSYGCHYVPPTVTGPHHHDYMSSYQVPLSYQQYVYWSAIYSPIYMLPIPLCLEPEESLPKTAMVPPEYLHTFNTTQPPQRQWIPLSRPETGRPAAIFTVMCYNVLCDKYCTRQQYGYCPSWGLNWEYRKKSIMDEIRQYAADIIGLQEVETDQFYNYFKPELEREEYQGIFSPKSRARTMTEQERKHVDGCAIFFKTSKFSLVKEHLIEFNQLAMANAEGSDEMLNRVMTKDNIGLTALLETREGVFDSSGGLPPEGQIKQPLLVTTAHMHWDPEFSDVKLIQTMMLMSELKKVVEDSYLSLHPEAPRPVDCNSIPIILCGDLNSLPESGVIEYLSTGRVSSNHIDFKELGYEACLQTFNCHKDATQLTHNFALAKAYEDNLMRNTNYTFDFKGIIDYIFYSRHYMNLLGVLGPMDENWFHENKVVGCPHPHIPSDHFPLFIEFEMPVPYPDISTILNNDETTTPVTNSGTNLGAIGSGMHKNR